MRSNWRLYHFVLKRHALGIVLGKPGLRGVCVCKDLEVVRVSDLFACIHVVGTVIDGVHGSGGSGRGEPDKKPGPLISRGGLGGISPKAIVRCSSRLIVPISSSLAGSPFAITAGQSGRDPARAGGGLRAIPPAAIGSPCPDCGEPMSADRSPTRDHIHPRSKGYTRQTPQIGPRVPALQPVERITQPEVLTISPHSIRQPARAHVVHYLERLK